MILHLITIAYCNLLFQPVEANHFRGGTVTWKYSRSYGSTDEIEVRYRMGYEIDGGGCSESKIKSGVLNHGHGNSQGSWDKIGDSSSALSGAENRIVCTAYENQEWGYGYNSFLTNLTSKGPLQIRFTGGSWISGGSWIVPVTVNLGIRSDTGCVNNPPSTFNAPIIKLMQGCSSTIEIKFIDMDNDRVTCRYANKVVDDECGSVCGALPSYFTLDQNACTIRYNGLGSTIVVPVAIMLEDHPPQTITLDGVRQFTSSDSLSKVPLQFVVQVVSASSCNVVPTYPPLALSSNTKIRLPKHGMLSETLYAYPSTNSASITQFIILGPVGVMSSTIFSSGSELYAVNITWTPTQNQTEENFIICYYAVDSTGKRGEQKCFNVETAATYLCEIDNAGCSDICMSRGSLVTCNCSNECWGLMSDRRTCAPPLDITCDGERINISMPGCSSNRTVIAGDVEEYFLQNHCQSTRKNSRHILQFSPLQCGVTTWANPVEFVYSVNLWIWQARKTSSWLITRGEWRQIPVTCSLPASAALNGSFVPELPFNSNLFPKGVAIEGMGAFSLFFDLYTSANYSTAVDPTTYPLHINVSDRIFFSIGAIGQGQLKFFVQECTASTTDSTGLSTIEYSFIENGCFVDHTLQRYYLATGMEERFSLEAFEFEDKLLSSREDADILISCQVMLCDATNSSTRCHQGCRPSLGRRKRSAETEIPNSGIARPRIAREVSHEDGDDDDDEEEVVLPISISESPLQTSSQRIILVVKKTTDSDDGDNPGQLVNWILIGTIGLLIFVVIITKRKYFSFKDQNKKSSEETVKNVAI